MLRDEEISLGEAADAWSVPSFSRLSVATAAGPSPRRTVAVTVEEANYQDLEKLAAGAFAVD